MFRESSKKIVINTDNAAEKTFKSLVCSVAPRRNKQHIGPTNVVMNN